jgi:hypothetical protein
MKNILFVAGVLYFFIPAALVLAEDFTEIRSDIEKKNGEDILNRARRKKPFAMPLNLT